MEGAAPSVRFLAVNDEANEQYEDKSIITRVRIVENHVTVFYKAAIVAPPGAATRSANLDFASISKIVGRFLGPLGPN